jgi:hypothetical protein
MIKFFSSRRVDWIAVLWGCICLLNAFGLYIVIKANSEASSHLRDLSGLTPLMYCFAVLGIAAVVGYRPAVWLIAIAGFTLGVFWIVGALYSGVIPAILGAVFFGLFLVLPLVFLVRATM